MPYYGKTHYSNSAVLPIFFFFERLIHVCFGITLIYIIFLFVYLYIVKIQKKTFFALLMYCRK